MDSPLQSLEMPLAARVLLWLIGLLFMLLPLLSGLSFWQMMRCRGEGNEPLARSWADATRSFLGMTVASWCLGGAGLWAIRFAMAYLETLRRG